MAALALLLTACAGPFPKPKPAPDQPQSQAAPRRIAPETRETFRQAVAALQAGDYEAAARALEPLAAPPHAYPGALLNLAIAYRHQDRLAEAEALLLQVAEMRPAWAAVQNELGIVQRRRGRFQAARDAYERALALNEAYADAHLNLGVLCDLYLRDLACALTQYQRYQALTPDRDKQVKIWIADVTRRMEDRK